ncbi:MAG: hypothetical protein GY943_15805 [Chloroflexi bacterium]|nr:hypothetical protein [Chloroflexota bacterium]
MQNDGGCVGVTTALRAATAVSTNPTNVPTDVPSELPTAVPTQAPTVTNVPPPQPTETAVSPPANGDLQVQIMADKDEIQFAIQNQFGGIARAITVVESLVTQGDVGYILSIDTPQQLYSATHDSR